MTNIVKIPKLEDILAETPQSQSEDKLMVILNQAPQEKWLKTHPLKPNVKYLPIEKIEFLLNAIYGGHEVEVKQVQVLANSVQVTVRLHVTNPLTGKPEYQDGVGAWPIQVNKGAKATDFSEVKSDGVQLAVPAAKSESIKDAAHHFGRIFGRDVNRTDVMSYESLLPSDNDIESELKSLWEEKKAKLNPEEFKAIERIIFQREKTGYDRALKLLRSK